MTERALMTTTFAETSEMAKTLAKSSLLPPDLRGKEADVLVTILAGRELGIGPMAALRSIHVVKGKPILSADGMVAVALASGLAEYFILVQGDDKAATYETKRKGSPKEQRLTFSMAEATRAGLANGDNWRRYPAAMLRARAKAALARDVYPDALVGVYEEDEGHEMAGRPDRHEHVIDVDVEPEQPDSDLVKRLEASITIARGEGTQALEALMAELRPLPEGPAKDGLRAMYKEAHRFAVSQRLMAPPSGTAESAEPQPSPSSAPSAPISTSGPQTSPTGPRPTTSTGSPLHSDDQPKASGRRRRVPPTSPTSSTAVAAPSLPLGNPPGVPQSDLSHEEELDLQDLEKTAKVLLDERGYIADFAEKLAKVKPGKRKDRLVAVLAEVRAEIAAEHAAADAAADPDPPDPLGYRGEDELP